MAEHDERGSSARRYEIGGVVGRGGFGTVYRATLHTEGGFAKAVAIKVLHDDIAARADPLARLRDEARMLGLVRHRALVAADSLIHFDGRWAVVMEFVEGASLDEAIRSGPLPARAAIEAAAEVAAALDAAYRAQPDGERPMRLLHRDVKPSNVRVGPAGEVKLLDFGVARADFDAREAQTRGVVYGSRPYLAPERLELHDSHAGDVFALGVSLAEIVTGLPPGPVAARPTAHADRIGPLLDAAEAASRSPEVRSLLAAMLAYEPEARPDAATVAREALRLAAGVGGPGIAEWAADRVGALLAARGPETGELTGRAIAESESGAGPFPGDPFGATGAGTTFSWSVASPVSEDGALEGSDGIDPAADPEPALSRRRIGRALIGSLALSGTAAIAAIAAIFGAVGIAAIAAIAAIAPEVARHGCVSMADEMEVRLDGAGAFGPGGDRAPPLRAITAEATRRCATGEIGMVGANRLLMYVQKTTADGAFDAADRAGFEALADEVLGASQRSQRAPR